MLLALLVLAVVAIALALPLAARRLARLRKARAARRSAHRSALPVGLYDPGRERRAEQRARELLRSCVNHEEWAMYRDLGFIRVHGSLRAEGPGRMAQRRRRRDLWRLAEWERRRRRPGELPSHTR